MAWEGDILKEVQVSFTVYIHVMMTSSKIYIKDVKIYVMCVFF